MSSSGASIAPDLYTPALFVPWETIEETLERLADATDLLQSLVQEQQWNPEALARILMAPGVLEIVRHVLATPSAVGFVDGREIPIEAPKTEVRARRLAQLLIDIELPRLMPPDASVRDLLRVGVVGLDARRRGFRRRDFMETDVSKIIRNARASVHEETGHDLQQLGRWEWPEAAQGRVETVLAVNKTPVAAVANVFLGQSGGRQQRVLTETYPRLQQDLDAVPLLLILIIDGRGVRETPRYVLERLVQSVGACMNRTEARQGALADALAEAVVNLGARPGRQLALETLVASALTTEVEVRIDQLPEGRDQALVALGQYKAEHPELALDLDLASGRLAWTRTESVARVQQLRTKFLPEKAAQLLADLLDLRDISHISTTTGLSALLGTLPTDQILPPRMLVTSDDGTVDADLIRSVARLNRQRGSGGPLAALVVRDVASYPAVPPSLQRQMATSVVVLDVDDLFDIAGAISARDAFVRLVLQQADLTKANPFNPTGATSAAMFFGRQEEEARLLATLHTNSAALIGGRRIGKTSLMQHAVASLRDAGWAAYYADCQAVGNWRDFIAHIAPRWKVRLPDRFEPANLALLVEQLSQRASVPLVIALDEIDNLLHWDETSSNGHVREAFFRACRAISQEGAAQFIFSGERRIAGKLSDPSSPHWNFCRPIPVQQLTRQASDALISTPLAALGVKLSQPHEILNTIWRYTSGHPQILQFLGDRIIQVLNQAPPAERSLVGRSLVTNTVGSAQYQRHYLETYWGQSSTYEKLITAVIADGASDFDRLRDVLVRLGVPADGQTIAAALRMLSLYGIVDDIEGPLKFRAAHFPAALDVLGGADAMIEDLGGLVRAQNRTIS